MRPIKWLNDLFVGCLIKVFVRLFCHQRVCVTSVFFDRHSCDVIILVTFRYLYVAIMSHTCRTAWCPGSRFVLKTLRSCPFPWSGRRSIADDSRSISTNTLSNPLSIVHIKYMKSLLLINSATSYWCDWNLLIRYIK